MNIDELVYKSVFGSNQEKVDSRKKIHQLAIESNIIPSSINDLYMKRGSEDLPHTFTVPAMNIRGMTYDTARAAFKAAKKLNVGTLIFELARSEMAYTDQPPIEYATVIKAAAIKEEWSGPLFLQCDHFQAKAASPGNPIDGDIQSIKDLIKEAINAGFFNVDIDMSTLVNNDLPTEEEQQAQNIKYSLEFIDFVRNIEPQGITISLGGEIGHIGGVNSSKEDFIAYMEGVKKGLNPNITGLSKISVNTGSSHGGVVLEDGTLAKVDIDFSILKDLSVLGRDKYQIGGTVQHGASTLPDEHFNQFVKSQAVEVHLATGFQNIQFDHPAFPKDLLENIYSWIDENLQNEKKEDMTDEQLHYKLRKKAWGEFKQQTWDIPEEIKTQIRESLEQRFEFFFNQLGVINSMQMVNETINPVVISTSEIDFGESKEIGNVEGLDD